MLSGKNKQKILYPSIGERCSLKVFSKKEREGIAGLLKNFNELSQDLKNEFNIYHTQQDYLFFSGRMADFLQEKLKHGPLYDFIADDLKKREAQYDMVKKIAEKIKRAESFQKDYVAKEFEYIAAERDLYKLAFENRDIELLPYDRTDRERYLHFYDAIKRHMETFKID